VREETSDKYGVLLEGAYDYVNLVWEGKNLTYMQQCHKQSRFAMGTVHSSYDKTALNSTLTNSRFALSANSG
jgi:hypothetical protein